MNTLDKRQSEVIDALRLPLIILVLFMHIVPLKRHIPNLDEGLGKGIYTFITEYIAHSLGWIAVPLFFLFSGYLFFAKVPDRVNLDFYKLQWSKRIKTLLIPYILWNLAKLLMIFLIDSILPTIKGLAHGADYQDITWDKLALPIDHFIPLEWLWAPIDEPLWYVRDLMCMTLLAPVFYFIVKYFKLFGVIALALIFFANPWHVGGLSTMAIFYFGLGAFFSINKKNILECLIPYGIYPFVLCLLSLSVGTLFANVGDYVEYWLRPACLLGVLGSFTIMDKLLLAKPRIKDILLKYSTVVFFVYAVHELYFKNWIKGLWYRTPLADDLSTPEFERPWTMILGYFIMPFILFGICLALNYATKRFFPRTYAYLTGSRN